MWPLTFHDGCQLSDECHASDTEVLTNGHFLVEDRNSAKDHGRQVGDQKSTSDKTEKLKQYVEPHGRGPPLN